MFELSVKTRFSAAHELRGYPGACASVHGHNWDVEVFVRGEELDATGLLIDFRCLREEVRRVVGTIDHSHLNEVEPFRTVNPTSENMARFLFEALAATIDSERYRVSRVAVNETPEARAVYGEEPWRTQ